MEELFRESLDEDLYQMVLSNPRNSEKISKAKIVPVMVKGALLFQETAYVGNQVFHENINKDAMLEKLSTRMTLDFGQCNIENRNFTATLLVSKKGKRTISRKRPRQERERMDLSHNRVKNYILQEGNPVPFLIELGVMTQDGIVVKSKYDKFRQINRFLEFLEDILPAFDKNNEIRMIDFGCGKSYLTFAVYYYFKILKGLDIRITGLDLKKDVIEECRILAEKFKYDKLEFIYGDIGTFEGTDKADLVMTLHACDTATDYALAKALQWNARVILSVPCCHHEVNKQISSDVLEPILKYGLIKERISALVTDAVRANLLEERGYQVQILEFIDMEHTPKNILIRAVRKNIKGKAECGIKETADFLNIHTTLQDLI